MYIAAYEKAKNLDFANYKQVIEGRQAYFGRLSMVWHAEASSKYAKEARKHPCPSVNVHPTGFSRQY